MQAMRLVSNLTPLPGVIEPAPLGNDSRVTIEEESIRASGVQKHFLYFQQMIPRPEARMSVSQAVALYQQRISAVLEKYGAALDL